MTDFTQSWAWPQWFIVCWFVLSFMLNAADHGKPELDKDGKPAPKNAFFPLLRYVVLTLVLIAGGFFA